MKLLQPKEAVRVIRRLLEDRHNMMWVSSGKSGSGYFSKVGTYLKIRVADHRANVGLDICHEIIIDSPTIMPDCEHRARVAAEAFHAAIRNKQKRCA